MNLEQQLNEMTGKAYGKSIALCTDAQLYECILKFCRDRIDQVRPNQGRKKVYYISMEFLIGRLLKNNLINLGIYQELREVLKKNGKDINRIEQYEPEPSLGNGGLGRLAACFLDSIATMGLNGDGIGLNYHFGLFHQKFKNHLQVPERDEWIQENGWLKPTDLSFDISFGEKKVKANMYDIDIIGYDNGVNKLHLFDLEGVEENLVTEGITFDKKDIEKNLTLFLYPDDSDQAGNRLRIYQEYFLVSCGAQFILHEMKKQGCNLHQLYEYAVIQINDTHPTMIIPELIRLLTEEEGFSLDEAIEIVRKTCAYTNHTILAEALEKWPLKTLKEVVPNLVPIIEELDARIKAEFLEEAVWIIDKDEIVHMANLDIHYGFSVNGVAYLHTEILKNSELNVFYKIYPQKFSNKTNGITFRRWLLCCNEELTDILEESIGDGFHKDALQLNRLLKKKEEESLLERLFWMKQQKKKQLADFVWEKEGIRLPIEAIYDIQIKRLHEYKRQQMNALYIIHKYLEIKRGKKPNVPLVYIFGAKAAPAYVIAQDIIHLILVLMELIRTDPEVNQYIQVVMVENYNVTYAEKLIPACDISEQISLASKEASGTGNMKFMLNGAVTIGTQDGANIEISQLVGKENIYIFGESSEKVIEHYRKKDYIPRKYYENSPMIKEAVDFILSEKMLAIGNKENLERLYQELLNKDWFMTLLDFEEYVKVKEQAYTDYNDKGKWRRMMLTNIAKAGYFSADRTIEEYNKDIWKLS